MSEFESETPQIPPPHPVTGQDRMDFLPALFPNCFMVGEATVYSIAGSFCVEYTGGFWAFMTNDAGLIYMRPEGYGQMQINQPMNGWQGELSADAFGVVCTLIALSYMLEKNPGSEALAANHSALYDYVFVHPEVQPILGAID